MIDNNIVYTVRSGGSYAVGTMVDQFLDEEDVQELYAKWKDKWAIPLEYRGGEKVITCDMIADAPYEELVDIYGKKRAARLVKAAGNAPIL